MHGIRCREVISAEVSEQLVMKYLGSFYVYIKESGETVMLL